MSNKQSWQALVFYLLVAVAVTHPLWLHLGKTVPSDIGDPLLNTWILAWDAHAIINDPLHLFEANIFFPLPNTLAYSEHLLSTALLILPLGTAVGEPLMAHNASLLISFALAGLGMYLLVLRWTGSGWAGFLAGLVFAFAPYRLAAISHLQLLTIQWLPFSVLSLDVLLGMGDQKLLSARGVRWMGLFVIFTWMQILSSWYLAVFTGLVLLLYTLSWLVATVLFGGKKHSVSTSPAKPVRQDKGGGFRSRCPVWIVLLRLLLAAGIIALLVLPVTYPYVEVLPQLQASRPATLAASLAAAPTDYLAAAPFLRFSGPLTEVYRTRPGFTEENQLFLGLIGPILALLGLCSAFLPLLRRTGDNGGSVSKPRRSQTWRVAALAFTLLVSLFLTFSGPYLALIQVFPIFQVIRVPSRWIIPATFALAALAGFGVSTLQNRLESSAKRILSTVLLSLLGLWILAEAVAVPLPLAQVGNVDELPVVYPAIRQDLAASGVRPGAVIELPMYVAPAPEYPETKRMLASSLGWWGLVNGYSGFTPARQYELGRAMSDFPSRAAFEALRRLGESGVRYLVVHPSQAPLDPAQWHAIDRWAAEKQTTLLPMGDFGPDSLYLINPYGDGLVTHPDQASDPYWSHHKPQSLESYFVSSETSDGPIQLRGSLVLPRATDSTGTVSLTLYWTSEETQSSSYTVFVHSLDATGQMIGQSDSLPVNNHYPTSSWQPGEIVQDTHLVPEGSAYRVGLYDSATGQRLPAFDSGGTPWPDNAVPIPSDDNPEMTGDAVSWSNAPSVTIPITSEQECLQP